MPRHERAVNGFQHAAEARFPRKELPPMVLSELLQALRKEGLPADGYRIHYAISVGYLPRPEIDGSRRYRFSPADLAACRTYLSNLPKPGRKKQQA